MLLRIIVQIYNRMKYYAPQVIYKDYYKYSLVRDLRLKTHDSVWNKAEA